MMEGYFVRTLGMHRVYNSAFMNMLKQEENAKYRLTIKNVLEFNPEILKRFVNFMNNPDEKTAVEQFGAQGKYFGACVLLATMPGLPMFGHGQIEGFHEKYGMEYRRAYWDESVDQGLVKGHELWIFPLLKHRRLFSGSAHFALYDFYCHDGSVDENVFAYSNRIEGQRALVLYNNRYGKTAGWIRTAAPVAVKTGDETTELRSISLGEALAVPDDQGSFLAFLDLSTGHEYLRNAADVCRQGLFAELAEYEFHVFLDFRVVTDTETGAWKRLCDHLAGRGVTSLDEELIQLEYKTLIAAFTACLHQLVQPTSPLILKAAVQHYCESVPPVIATVSSASQAGLVESLTAAHVPAIAATTLRLVRQSGVSRAELPLTAENRRCALALLVTTQLVLPLSDDALHEYGLGRPLAAFVAGGSAMPERSSVKWTLDLCNTVALAWKRWSCAADSQRLACLFDTKPICHFLMVHEDGGILWFNKERFDELLKWLALLAAFDKVQDSEQPLVQVTELRILAKLAGYRVRIMLDLFRNGAERGL